MGQRRALSLSLPAWLAIGTSAMMVAMVITILFLSKDLLPIGIMSISQVEAANRDATLTPPTGKMSISQYEATDREATLTPSTGNLPISQYEATGRDATLTPPVVSKKRRNETLPHLMVSESARACQGRWIYIYNISEVYNSVFVYNCSVFKKGRDLCMYMKNGGLGEEFEFGAVAPGAWYNTWQFSLELYFHNRLLQHPCATTDAGLANAFYVPFYAGMDLSHTNTHRVPREKLNSELAAWLTRQPSWTRRGGRDHFITLGRIARDFRKQRGAKSWGNEMLRTKPFMRMLKLTIERDTTEKNNKDVLDNEIAIPYPTYFHPSADAEIQSLVQWASESSQRIALVSMAVGKRRRPKSPRQRLVNQCGSDPHCTLLLCEGHEASPGLAEEVAKGSPGTTKLAGKTISVSCNNPVALLKAMHQSEFCLQPPGDSPTRRSFFDAMLAGCIPVIFSKEAAWSQYVNHLPEKGESYSVFIPMFNVNHPGNVMRILSNIKELQIRTMRRNIVQLLPHILYAHTNRQHQPPPDAKASKTKFLATPDAFDMAIDTVFTKLHSSFSAPK